MNVILTNNDEQNREMLQLYKAALERELVSVDYMIEHGLVEEDWRKHQKLYYDSLTSNYSICNTLNLSLDVMDVIPELSDFEMTISNEGAYYKIECNQHIYKNPPIYDKYNVWAANREWIAGVYKYSLTKALNRAKLKIHSSDSVGVVFIQHYKKGKTRNIVDLDNFSTKIFIDTVIVKGGFVLDDDPVRMKVFSIASVEDEREYTEILVGEVHQVLSKAIQI